MYENKSMKIASSQLKQGLVLKMVLQQVLPWSKFRSNEEPTPENQLELTETTIDWRILNIGENTFVSWSTATNKVD